MHDVNKPKRTASSIKKTREGSANKQGQREMAAPRNERIVEAERIIGIRRAELARLTGECLTSDYAGNLCVLVQRGKGGKKQLQRILPKDIPFIQRLFDGIGGKQNVFAPAELRNKIPLHALRRMHAQEAYTYYLELIRQGHRRDLIHDLQLYFMTYHTRQPGLIGERRLAKQFERFKADLTKDGGVYRLRGANKTRAMEAGRPTIYDRLALMAVSVLHLAHWRVDVTVRNYML